MKTLRSAQLIIVLCVIGCRAIEYEGFTVYDIFPTKEQEHLLKSLFVLPGYDVWKTILGERVTVMVDPSLKRDLLDYLRKNGIKHSVYIENVASFRNVAVNESSRLPSSGSLPSDLFGEYLSHRQMNNYLHLLAEKYPDLVHVQHYGISYEKRQLYIVKISTENSGIEKPIILIDAGIHAREWIAPAMALFIINQLVENEANRYLTEEIEWHITPLINPDGYEYSRYKDIWWRKTRSSTGISNCPGVDGNRNFDFHWMECGASSDACSGSYAGEKPFSEMETQALRDYVISIKDQLKLYLTFHSYGPYILYPWGYTRSLPDNAAKLQAIAERANEAQMRAGGPRFGIGSSENTLYCASGGSDDWVMGRTNASLAFTIEMPPGGESRFHPPQEDIRKYVTPVFEAVRTFAHYVTGYELYDHSGLQRKSFNGAVMNTKRHPLHNKNYIHTGCLLVIEFILQCNFVTVADWDMMQFTGGLFRYILQLCIVFKMFNN